MKKRRVFLVLAILVFIALGYFSYYTTCIFGFIGFILAKFFGGKCVGRQGRIKSIVFSWRKFELHLHHWTIAVIIGSSCAAMGLYVITPQLFYGFLGGLLFQGTYCYDDWYRIIRIKVPVESSLSG